MQNNYYFRSTPRQRLCLGLGLLLVVLLLPACGQLDPGWGALLYNVTVAPDAITPNADGNDDVTQITYSLRRAARVSIYFTNSAGERYYFRQERRRSPGDYRVLWGGATDETRTVETGYGPQEILSQVLPDGVYQWTITATDDDGATAEVTGSITLQDGDTQVPELHNFAVVPQLFKPNQDGLRDDSVSISYYLTKNVESEVLYLMDPANPALKRYIAPKPGLTKPNEQGYREYRYEGDVDNNAEPPPDGTYQLVGEARDRAGNAVRVVRELTIAEGGKPRAEVAGGDIVWYILASGQRKEVNRLAVLTLGDQLCFEAYIHNYGVTPIRTDGPWPGQVYKFTENRNTVALRHKEETISTALPEGSKAWLQQDGVWRFGINYESAGLDFPFRWAIGGQENLERRLIDGNEQWYLLPKKSGLVQGCIEFDEPPPLNTNIWSGGLIHESVAVVNNNIDRITVQVETPAEKK
ncbi:MAG: hypothetical protein DYG89_46225 [Caldilinea sp. CFX5]|nr:hypothetical protein [Caldilinea sp. CFX5]